MNFNKPNVSRFYHAETYFPCNTKNSTKYDGTTTINYLLTYLLTAYSIVLQKLTGSQLVKQFPTFYRTRKFISVFASAHHLSLS